MTLRDVVILLWGLAAASLAWWQLRRLARVQLHARMGRLGIETSPIGSERSTFAPRQALSDIGHAVHERWPGAATRVSSLVPVAGVVGPEFLDELIGWKVLGAVAGLIGGILLLLLLAPSEAGLLGLVFLPALGIVGWFGVDIWLARRAVARRRAIVRSLLTVMDLLTHCMEAGMGIDRALRLICERVQSPLTEELRRVLAEIDLGVARRDAFTGLAERVPADEIRSLTTAIIQAEELSASLAVAMRTQSRALRLAQRHATRAEAHRAPIRMMIPMVLFVLPALFIIIIGPVAIQLGQALGGG